MIEMRRPLDGLISNLRCTPPLERSESEMAAVLADFCSRGVMRGIPLEVRAGGYTRTCAYFDDRFELLLLNWARGSVSDIHDHGGEHCWLAVIDGSLEIENYDRLDDGKREGRAEIVRRDSAILVTGQLDLRSGPLDIHRVANAGTTPAISLHVYARPLRHFGVYDEWAQRCRTVRSRYDAILAPVGAY
jgi:predicted metal-dependent enzyme (double-stranded beta helix superfamily)